jgi:hypothetical protein
MALRGKGYENCNKQLRTLVIVLLSAPNSSLNSESSSQSLYYPNNMVS